MKLNKKTKSPTVLTHGGVPAKYEKDSLKNLRRSVCACMLWEDTFYEDGMSIADRIETLVGQCDPEEVAELAIEVRSKMNLRHVPLLMAAALAKKGGSIVSYTLENIIQRPDELSEFLAVYWRNGKTPISNQVKKGLGAAFRKFNEYSLAKYNGKKDIRLRDVLKLCHAKPLNSEQADLWLRLMKDELKTPDTWEVQLSAGKDKKETFTRLIQEGKLGYLALLRNLRNMVDAGVDRSIMKNAILAKGNGSDKILPFRYVAAARACPSMSQFLDVALLDSINKLPALTGTTVVLVDCSGSMHTPLSGKSDLSRADAAAALACVLNAEDIRVFSFADNIVEVPAHKGLGGIEPILKATAGGTALAGAVRYINENVKCDRLIVITDEQATDGAVPAPKAKHAYMVNVATYQNGVGYGQWTRIHGFSENVIRWIYEYEKEFAQ